MLFKGIFTFFVSGTLHKFILQSVSLLLTSHQNTVIIKSVANATNIDDAEVSYAIFYEADKHNQPMLGYGA